jgi:tRNA(fMet)-specific endonuclease VapC
LSLVTTYLFDTNIVIDIFHQTPDVMQKAIQLQAQQDTYVVSTTVVGELTFGALHARRGKEQALQQVRDFIQVTPVLACDKETGQMYGEIKEILSSQGTMIPENDIWIAVVARQHALTIVTRDAHFAAITGLLLEQW